MTPADREEIAALAVIGGKALVDEPPKRGHNPYLLPSLRKRVAAILDQIGRLDDEAFKGLTQLQLTVLAQVVQRRLVFGTPRQNEIITSIEVAIFGHRRDTNEFA